MVGTQQQGLLRYEERVRLERANGLRKDEDTCVSVDGCGCTPHDEAFMRGMTYEQLAKTPLRQNAVCPHTKIIVPITPAFTVDEPVTKLTAEYPAKPYLVVDRNPCDGRTVMLQAIPHSSDVEVKHATTGEIHTTKVEDTMFDVPAVHPTVNRVIGIEGEVKQPIAVNGTETDLKVTNDGKQGKKKNPATEA